MSKAGREEMRRRRRRRRERGQTERRRAGRESAGYLGHKVGHGGGGGGGGGLVRVVARLSGRASLAVAVPDAGGALQGDDVGKACPSEWVFN